jgi:hypothetical protein
MITTIKRANIRLRLERGLVRLQDVDAGNIVCEVIDISEGGCACRIDFAKVDRVAAGSWKTALAPGRILGSDFSQLLQVPGLLVPACEVRWVNASCATELVFGSSFSGLDEQTKSLLGQAIVQLASQKLRLSKTYAVLPSRAEIKSHTLETTASNQQLATPVTARMRPLRRVFEQITDFPVAPPRVDPKLKSHDTLTQVFAPFPVGATNVLPRQDPMLDRQTRHGVAYPVKFDFVDPEGNKLSEIAGEGHVRDFNEDGFMIEGPSPEFCSALDLQSREAIMLATIHTEISELVAKLQILSVKQSPRTGFWLYAVRIIDMPVADRARLRERYIRASFPQARTRAVSQIARVPRAVFQ